MRRLLLAAALIAPSAAWGAIALDSTAHPAGAAVGAAMSNNTGTTMVSPTFSSAAGDRVVVVGISWDLTGSAPTLAWTSSTPAGASTFTKVREDTWTSGTYASKVFTQFWVASAAQALSSVSITATRSDTASTSGRIQVYVLSGASSTVGGVAGKSQAENAYIDLNVAVTAQAANSWVLFAVLYGSAGTATLTADANSEITAQHNYAPAGATFAFGKRTNATTGSGSYTVGTTTANRDYSLVSGIEIKEAEAAQALTTAPTSVVDVAGTLTLVAPGVSASPESVSSVSGSLTLALSLSASPESTSAMSAGIGNYFPLSFHSSGRYLVDVQNRPWRIQADGAWLMSNKSTAYEVDAYLADRKAKGFNAFYLMAMVHPSGYAFDPNAANTAGTEPFSETSNPWGYFANPTEAYWSYIDTIIDKAAAQDMAVMLAHTYLGYACQTGSSAQGWAEVVQAMSSAQATAWGEWLGNRYKDKANVIWFDVGDCRPPSGSALEARTADIIRGIYSAGATQVHMAEHMGGDDVPSIDQAYLTTTADGPGSTLRAMNSFYAYGPSNNGNAYVTADETWGVSPARPAWQQEGIYEGDPYVGAFTGAAWETRRARIWTVLAGAIAGDGYANGDTWKWISFPSNLSSPGSTQASHAFAMFAAIPWWDMKPSGTAAGYAGKDLVTTGVGSWNTATRITSSVTSNGSHLLAYYPGTSGGSAAVSFTVDMTALAGTARARWWNPTTGAYTAIGSYANSGTRSFTTPGSNGDGNDWLLILDVRQEIAASPASVVDVAAPVRLTMAQTSAPASVVSVAGTLTMTMAQASAPSSVVNVVAPLTLRHAITSSIDASGALAAGVSGSGGVTGAPLSTSEVAGTLTMTMAHTAAPASVVSLAAPLTLAWQISSAPTSVVDLAAAVAPPGSLSTAAASVVDAVASLSLSLGLTASPVSLSSVGATLTLPGTADLQAQVDALRARIELLEAIIRNAGGTLRGGGTLR